jgi:hypothetical protein
VVEIAISDISRGSEPSIRRTRVRRSSGIEVWHFGVYEDRGTVAPGIAILRNAISQQSDLWAPEGVIGTSVIAHRGSEFGGPMHIDNGNRDILKRDFSTGLRA